MKIIELNAAIRNFERERVIGEITCYLPKPPHYKKIANWDLAKKDQKFNYTKQPPKNEQPTNEFLKQEFERFQNGYWFFNNGTIEYLTPFHYFFLNYWNDVGKPMKFIDSQREACIWIRQIEHMDNMMGGNLLTNRRFGKTVLSTAWGYFRTATTPFHHCGIQSKTNKDGKQVFAKLIKSWQKLPDYIKPVDSGETRPATVLEFSEPRGRVTKEKKVYADVLGSFIDFQASVEDAYDGSELHTYIEDECGKTVEINTDIRWGVVKYCLLIGAEIVGKALRTTTVEEQERRGGKNFKKTWDDSMVKTLNESTGRTNSLLTNLFIPADYGLKGVHPKTKQPFVNAYGISNRKLAAEYILSTWEGLNEEKLKEAQRKDPLTLKHAFQVSNNGGAFDQEAYDYLDMQKEYLDGTSITGECAPKNLRRRVSFKRNDAGLSYWEDDPIGHASIVWDFPEQSHANARKMGENQRFMPTNTEDFAGGIDPFAATIVTGPGSMGVLYIYRKGDPNDPENSGLMVCRYAQRTRLKKDFHRMVMTIVQYYGCKANYESDVDDYYETFMEDGFKNYVMWRPKCTIDPTRRNVTIKYGTPSKDPYALQKHFQIVHEYILSRWHKIYFIEVIEQLIEYDPLNRTEFDEVVAFGMALIGGFQSGSNVPKDTRTNSFIKFKQSHRLGIRNQAGVVDFSEYHKKLKD